MTSRGKIAVFGAYGHTGRFVAAELLRRGWSPILAGRDEAKLRTAGAAFPGAETRAAAVDDPASLDRAFAGAAAVIHCAGPFLDTSEPVVEAALRARIHYLDVAAEQRAALNVFERFSDAARQAEVALVPGMAFYGGFGDLLATAALGDWEGADEIALAIALDCWWPTEGTRRTGERNTFRRLLVTEGRLAPVPDPPPTRAWDFPPPFGPQEVVGIHLTETILMAQHLEVQEIRAYINRTPLADLNDPATPAPVAADESGRSSQLFLVEAVARKGGEERRAIARGRDIYAFTAPLVVEAAERVVDGRCRGTGVLAAGEAFDAQDVLRALTPEHLSLELR